MIMLRGPTMYCLIGTRVQKALFAEHIVDRSCLLRRIIASRGRQLANTQALNNHEAHPANHLDSANETEQSNGFEMILGNYCFRRTSKGCAQTDYAGNQIGFCLAPLSARAHVTDSHKTKQHEHLRGLLITERPRVFSTKYRYFGNSEY